MFVEEVLKLDMFASVVQLTLCHLLDLPHMLDQLKLIVSEVLQVRFELFLVQLLQLYFAVSQGMQ